MPNPSTLQQHVKPKVWGESIALYRDDAIEVAKVRIKAGGYSSAHRHRGKHNQFVVLTGELRIVYGRQGDSEITLVKDQTCEVVAGVWHRFVAATYVEALEIYRSADGSNVDPDDIEREDVGGVLEPEAVT